MSTTWKHPDLGEFTFAQDRWATKVKIPAFKAFSYPTFGKRSGGTYDLLILRPAFGPSANSDPPSPDEVRIASQIFTTGKSLPGRITAALWDEFHGRGPTSESWWDGKIDEIRNDATLAGLSELKEPDDVKFLLKASQIVVGKLSVGSDATVAMITFHTAFEEEHGLGVLTDGAEVLGTGYVSDGTIKPYKPRKSSRSRSSK